MPLDYGDPRDAEAWPLSSAARFLLGNEDLQFSDPLCDKLQAKLDAAVLEGKIKPCEEWLADRDLWGRGGGVYVKRDEVLALVAATNLPVNPRWDTKIAELKASVGQEWVKTSAGSPSDKPSQEDVNLLTVTDATHLYIADRNRMYPKKHIKFGTARSLISKVCNKGILKTNGLTGKARRIRRSDLDSWLLSIRNRDLEPPDAENEEDVGFKSTKKLHRYHHDDVDQDVDHVQDKF